MHQHDARTDNQSAALAQVWWRPGRNVLRTVYGQLGAEADDGDILIGLFDSALLAAEAVASHNARLSAPPERWILTFSYRADDGPRFVGPFPSRSAAQDYLDRLGIDFEANAAPLAPPVAA